MRLLPSPFIPRSLLMLTLALPTSAFAQVEAGELPEMSLAAPASDSGFNPEPFRLGFHIGPITMGHSASQSTPQPVDAYPQDASFSQTLFDGPVGFTTGLVGWWDITDTSSAGAALRTRWASYSLQIGDHTTDDTLLDIMAGALYQYRFQPTAAIEAGLWYHSIDGGFFQYTNGQANAVLLDLDIHALHASVAFSGEAGDMGYRVEVGESFGIAPTTTALNVSAHYNLPAILSPQWPWYVGVEYGFAYRNLSATTSQSEIEVTGTTHTLGLTLGVGFDASALAALEPLPSPEPGQAPTEEFDDGGLEL